MTEGERPLTRTARYKLDDPVVTLRGIGPRWAEELAETGVATIGDLVWHLPFRYSDRRQIRPLSEARDGVPMTALGLVRDVSIGRTRKRHLDVLTVVLDDGTAALRVVFFGRAYLSEYIRPGARLLVHGAPRYVRGGLELHGPEFEVLRPEEDPNAQTNYVPVYEKLGPLSGRRLRAVIADALDGIGDPEDLVPTEFLRRRGLPSLGAALREAHQPDPETPADLVERKATPALRRLAYEELLVLELALALARARRRLDLRGRVVTIDAALRETLRSLPPFTLTGAQERALAEIEADLIAPWPMSRLLLGDVGSGKTVVAALAARIAIGNGLQSALMAPTEILANQHAATLQRLLLAEGIKVDLLTASLPASEQERVRGRIAAGQARIVVGTHALISEKVRFKNLGLAIIDEQHRFGVEQRAELVAKGAKPDLLVMSATPIPRTLAMALFGDLDVSVLDEKPPGRKPIRTIVRRADQRERVFEGLGVALAEGRRVYVVRPAVEEGNAGLRAAEEGLREYQRRFPQVRVALVHGRQRAAERQAALADFQQGRVQVLVATTVIEVGIDVPEASVMVVEDADRFGLAQLHQLRGRVGRGDVKSYCVLVASEDASPTALERLAVLESTDDGFQVAEKDLEVRGPGEVAGTAQSGVPTFRVADLVRHRDLLLAAREDARRLGSETGRREDLPAALLALVMRRFGEKLRLADVG